VRIVVDGRGVGVSHRIAVAAAGLALRGHEVRWLGAIPEALAGTGLIAIRRRDLPASHAELVIGAGRPLGAVVTGWFAGAEAMVLAADAEGTRRWGPIQRWAWATLHSTALGTESEARALVEGARALPHDRVGLWPDTPAATAPEAAHADTEVLERAGERALARHRSRSPRPAVFVDRDGTLIVERGYLADPAGVELLPGVAYGLRALIEAGHPIVVITNQSGIGRGYFEAATAYAVMARLRRLLRAERVELTAIYFCPHAPDAGCPCRKPRAALLRRAAEDLVLALRASVMIGDKRIDVATGHNAGALGVLVRTGYGRDEEAAGMGTARPADAVADDLAAAADWVLARE
jgi:D-glycero-D-manno-heptose 1,7-bisphosphate phosphatase